MLAVQALPARHGDCLWLTYGRPGSEHRVLIDGGPAGCYAALKATMQALRPTQRNIELVIVTHIDVDHVDGVVALFEDDERLCTVDDVWFNGFPHLPGPTDDDSVEEFGPVSGERLSTALRRTRQAWNGTRPYGPSIVVPQSGPLPQWKLPGGLKLTLLSPDIEQLRRLRPKWKEVVDRAGLNPRERPSKPCGPTNVESFGRLNISRLAITTSPTDSAVANGTSIAVLAEYGRGSQRSSVLLAGDAHPDVLERSVIRLCQQRRIDRLHVNVTKVPHHGSQGNVTRTLLERLDCNIYLFSTNGAYFRHPDQIAVARVIEYGGARPELVFNYRTPHNQIWDNTILMQQHDYSVRFPDGGSGVEVTIP